MFEYVEATEELLETIWNMNIQNHPDDPRWISWKEKYIHYNQTQKAKTFIILFNHQPIGEGTLLFDSSVSAIKGNEKLVNSTTTNINALRILKPYEGQGHVSKLIHVMEQYAKDHHYQQITIGVEAKETRNLAIYIHWGYTQLVHHEYEDGELILYYQKKMQTHP